MTKVSIEEVQGRLNDGGDNVTIVDSRSDAAYSESDIKRRVPSAYRLMKPRNTLPT